MYSEFNNRYPNSFQELNKRYTQSTLRTSYTPEYIPECHYYYRNTIPKSFMLEYLHNESLEHFQVNMYLRSGNKHTYSHSRHIRLNKRY